MAALVPSLDCEAVTRSADEMSVAAPAAGVEGDEDLVDDLVVRHRIGKEGGGHLLIDPCAGGRIAERHLCPIDAARIRRLDDPLHPCPPPRVHPVWPVMIADRLAVPVDL